MERALTTKEAAEVLGVSSTTMYRMIKDGSLTPHKVGKQNRFPESQIAEIIGVKMDVKQEKVVQIKQRFSAEEDKSEICRAFITVLQMTRHYSDLVDLRYEKRGDRREIVVGTYESGFEVNIDVTCDSGVSMLKDILKGLAG